MTGDFSIRRAARHVAVDEGAVPALLRDTFRGPARPAAVTYSDDIAALARAAARPQNDGEQRGRSDGQGERG